RPVSSKILPPRKLLNKPPTKEHFSQEAKISSEIITNEHAREILSWIDEDMPRNASNYFYEFKQISNSVDSLTSGLRKTDLLIVMRISRSQEILGGYNPIGWSSSIIDQFLFGGTDLTLNLSNFLYPELKISCKHKDYEKPIRDTEEYSKIDRIEIFQVIKKDIE
ncbi:13452_t:CDS:2, partial [Acaulospora morrowiae]